MESKDKAAPQHHSACGCGLDCKASSACQSYLIPDEPGNGQLPKARPMPLVVVLARYVLDRHVGAELHRSTSNLTAACAQSNGGDQRRDNDHVFDVHSLLS